MSLSEIRTITFTFLTSIFANAEKHAPLSNTLSQAKTIFIVNQSGFQEIADAAFQEFTKWGKYSISSSRESADLIVTFTYVPRIVGGSSVPQFSMAIVSAKGEDALYQVIKGGVHTRGGFAKVCIEEYKKRLSESTP